MAYNYYVSAVRYNSDDTHIATLRVHPVNTDKTFDPTGKEMTRPDAVKLVSAGKTFCTIFKDANGKWNAGAKLEIISVSTDYLKTKNDGTTRDNLESLPRF